MTLSSNVRSRSYHFEIIYCDGDFIRVDFSLETHDREVLRCKATTTGITGEMVRVFIAESVEYRFGYVDRLPRLIH